MSLHTLKIVFRPNSIVRESHSSSLRYPSPLCPSGFFFADDVVALVGVAKDAEMSWVSFSSRLLSAFERSSFSFSLSLSCGLNKEKDENVNIFLHLMIRVNELTEGLIQLDGVLYGRWGKEATHKISTEVFSLLEHRFGRPWPCASERIGRASTSTSPCNPSQVLLMLGIWSPMTAVPFRCLCGVCCLNCTGGRISWFLLLTSQSLHDSPSWSSVERWEMTTELMRRRVKVNKKATRQILRAYLHSHGPIARWFTARWWRHQHSMTFALLHRWRVYAYRTRVELWTGLKRYDFSASLFSLWKNRLSSAVLKLWD